MAILLRPMAFSPVPHESKSQINRAGKILKAKNNVTPAEVKWAVDLTNTWRACHAYPINTFQATLRSKLKNGYSDYIVAQRLKRLPTIVDKLARYPNMQLTTMQDIGGLRAILSNVGNVYKLKSEYEISPHFKKMIIDEKDYIQCPRDDDGYRSLHLVFKYENSRNPAYDGLKLEMQIRTKLQHAWATAVETMGTFLGQALKSRQGDKEWLEFFAITSSAFAYKEGKPPVPRFAHLSRMETYRKVAELEKELSVIEKMRGFSVAYNAIKQGGKGSSYYLIVLDSINHAVEISRYDRDSFFEAAQDYATIEHEVSLGRKIVEPVLVSAGSIDKLEKAYPNFFLDTTEFTNALTSILKISKI